MLERGRRQKLEYWKETEASHCWKCKIGRAWLELYVKAWRVPARIPKVVRLELGLPAAISAEEIVTKSMFGLDPASAERPIPVLLKKHSRHQLTVRYEAVGGDQIGLTSLYIPKDATLDEAPELGAIVRWGTD